MTVILGAVEIEVRKFGIIINCYSSGVIEKEILFPQFSE